jgi:hypothetical protein
MRASRVFRRRLRDLTLLLTLVAMGEAVGAGIFIGWVAAKETAVSSNAAAGAIPQQDQLHLRLSVWD